MAERFVRLENGTRVPMEEFLRRTVPVKHESQEVTVEEIKEVLEPELNEEDEERGFREEALAQLSLKDLRELLFKMGLDPVKGNVKKPIIDKILEAESIL